MKHYWLMKSEPETFGIDDLARVRVEPWTGVRNFQARNHMRAMQVGDEVLFHHSNATPPGVAGLARVVRTGVVDETQFDPKSPYFDPTASRDEPRWDCVDVEFVEKFPRYVSLDELRETPGLEDMLLLRRGMRLSVQPVTAAEFKVIVKLGHAKPAATAAAPKPKPAAKPAKPAAKKKRA
jgi:predicted RNA-binding protein with PUA-like domain